MVPSRELLRDALAIWRETRAESIAAIVDQLTAALVRGWQPPAPKLNRTFHAAWLAAAGDDVTRGWAARSVLDKLPDRAALTERLTALLAAGSDPRVGRELAQLDKLASHEIAQQIVAASTEPERRPATPTELARFTAEAETTDSKSLEREVYARPDDDAPREVLADELQLRGDPRGELIALQLAREPSEAQATRIAELVRDHGATWLGPLAAVARRAQFERGYPTRIELRLWQGGDLGWNVALDHPGLATVEDVLPGTLPGARYAELIRSPRLTRLRRIEVADLAVVRALEQSDAELVHIACPDVDFGPYVQWLSKDVLPICVRFETLRSFACKLEGAAAVLGSPVGARLTALTVAGEIAAALAFWRSLRKPLELQLVERAGLPAIGPSSSLRLHKDGSRTIVRVTGAWAIAAAVEHWPLLGADRLELVEPGAATARLEQLATCELIRIAVDRSRVGVIELPRQPL